MACNISRASSLRHSPTMMRSGRIRRALTTNSRMRLAQPQLGRVLNGYDALVFRNVGGKHVQQRGLSGARSAGDDDIQPPLDAALQQLQHAFGQSQLLDQV